MARLQSTAVTFIQQQRADMPAADVAAAAARRGYVITTKQVWAARQRARARTGARHPSQVAPKKPHPLFAPRSEDAAADAEAERVFVAAVLRVGVERARALLADLTLRYEV